MTQNDLNPELQEENQRLLSALAAVGDYLYKNNTNMALAIIEGLVNGDEITCQNLSRSHSTSVSIFSSAFNRWCINQDLCAGWLAILPSHTRPGFSSVQIGGAKPVCALLDHMHESYRGHT